MKKLLITGRRFLLVYLFLAVLAAGYASDVKNRHDSSLGRMQEATRMKELALGALLNTQAMRRITLEILQDPERLDLAPVKTGAFDRILEQYKAMRALKSSPSLARLLGKLEILSRQITPVDTRVLELNFEDAAQARQLYSRSYAPMLAEYERLTSKMVEEADREASQAGVAKQTAYQAFLRGTAAIALTLGLSGVGLLGMMLVLTRRQICCIDRAVVGLRKVSEGDLSSRLHQDPDHSQDLAPIYESFNLMVEEIERRDLSLNQRNAEMELILRNAEQGFVMLDSEGRLGSEHSSTLVDWFGPFTPHRPFWEYLGASDPRIALSFSFGWEQLQSDILPLELCLDQLRTHFQVGSRWLAPEFRPALGDCGNMGYLLVISDITSKLERERAEVRHREMMNMFQSVMRDRAGFLDFVSEIGGLLKVLQSDTDLVTIRRTLHTIKGNTAIYGLPTMAQACHVLEDRLASGESLTCLLDDIVQLQTLWETRLEQLGKVLDSSQESGIRLRDPEYLATLDLVRKGISRADLELILISWKWESMQDRLERLEEMGKAIASRLGKENIVFEVHHNNLRLNSAAFTPFWNALVHLVGNAVDHGMESPAERLALGKGECGTISFTTRHTSSGAFEFRVEDDGRGVNWALVKERADSMGLPCETESELLEALLSEGMSTKVGVSQTSGRGVGLGAVRSACLQLGGTLAVQSRPGHGTIWTFHFPLPEPALLQDAA
jgi:HPt (histidine-containing phosphotransfer) domain-containing protein/two-component sensor histidine kinase